MRLGIAHHLGWAVAVTASEAHEVVDRRRMELIEPGLPNAPIEHEVETLSDGDAAALVAAVRASVARATMASLDELVAALPRPVMSMSLRAWPPDFPQDITTQRRPPYVSQADSVMYREVMAEVAAARGWTVHLYEPGDIEGQAASVLGPRAIDVLYGPRTTLGPPWTKDHRIALAATVLAG